MDADTCIRTLRQRGYRITPQRELIIKAVTESNEHLTAEEIYNKVKQVTDVTNLATVYRTLDLLFSEGMAQKNDLGGGKVYYAHVSHGSHLHLICKGCGVIVDAPDELLSPLWEQLAKQYRFDADLSHLSIYGWCSKCKQRLEKNELP